MPLLKNRSSKGQKILSAEVQQACCSERSVSSCHWDATARTEAVRRKAYELYEKRGCESGHEMEDWLEAERIVGETAK